MINSKDALIGLILITLIIGCSDTGTYSISDNISGKFVVDSYVVACSMKVNPTSDSLWGYLPVILKYHFKFWPGTINNINITIVSIGEFGMDLYYADPKPIGTEYTWSYGFWIHNSLSDINTVEVYCNVSGVFGTNGIFFGTFNWRNKQILPVHRLIH